MTSSSVRFDGVCFSSSDRSTGIVLSKPRMRVRNNVRIESDRRAFAKSGSCSMSRFATSACFLDNAICTGLHGVESQELEKNGSAPLAMRVSIVSFWLCLLSHATMGAVVEIG